MATQLQSDEAPIPPLGLFGPELHSALSQG